MVLENHMKLCMAELDFPEKKFLPPKLGKWTKSGLFKFIEKFCHYFLLNLFCNQNFYHLLCSSTNPIFGKIFVTEIWAKMLSANQIAKFFNQPYHQNKSIKKPDYLHVDTN